jgi:toxin YoeB
MKVYFCGNSLDEYDYAQAKDKKKLQGFIKALRRGSTLSQIPEPLTGNLSGWLSLKVNQKDRFVYRIVEATSENILEILQCLDHYTDH